MNNNTDDFRNVYGGINSDGVPLANDAVLKVLPTDLAKVKTDILSREEEAKYLKGDNKPFEPNGVRTHIVTNRDYGVYSSGRKAGGAFAIDEERADELVSSKRKVANDVENIKDTVRSRFGILYDIHKLEGGLDGARRGLGEIAGEFKQLANIDQSFINEGMYADDSLAKKMDELYISHDFVGNNSMEINSYNMSILGKVDGMSVNEGEKTLTNANIDESTNINKEGLVDITTGATVEQHAKEIEGINKENNFVQINKESDVSVNEITDESNVHEEMLANINKDGGTLEQHLEDNYSVQEQQLKDIANNNVIQKSELQMNDSEIKEDVNIESIEQ